MSRVALVLALLIVASTLEAQTSRRDALLFVWALSSDIRETSARDDERILAPADFVRDGGVCRDRTTFFVLSCAALRIDNVYFVYGYVDGATTLHAWIEVDGEHIEPATFGKAYDASRLDIKGKYDSKALLKLLKEPTAIQSFLRKEH